MKSLMSTKIHTATGVLLLLLWGLFPSLAHAQSLDATFNLKNNNPTGVEIIAAIREQTSFRFTYNGEVRSRLTGAVKTNGRQLRVKEALGLLQRMLKIGYEATGNYVVLNLLPDGPEQPPVITTGRLRGHVTELGNGQPLPGASVQITQLKKGVITNDDGRFQLENIPEGKYDLLVSFVGYTAEAREITVQAGKEVQADVQLKASQSIKEVVVVAYGSQKKITVTGAISTVKGQDLARSPVPDLSQAMVGRTPGILAQQAGGQPGNSQVTIRIRGASTIGNQDPLVLVDGVERPFNSINAEEVDNITVLKDASTTAVYGIRGANGVILVTTRRGTAGGPKISFNSNFSLQTPVRLPKYVNAYDYAVLYNEAQLNDNPNLTPDQLLFKPIDLQKYKDGSDPLFHPDIDWMDFMMKKTAPQSKNSLNISGGGKAAKYFLSLGYLDQGGLWKEFNPQYGYSNNTTYKRYNFRSNIDFNVTPTTVLGLSLGGFSDKMHTAGNPFYDIQSTPSGITPGLIDNKIIINNNVTGRNPLPSISAGYDDYFVNQFNITADLNQRLDAVLKGLSFRAKLGYDSDYRTAISKNVTRAKYELLLGMVDGVEMPLYRPINEESIGGESAASFSNRSKRIYTEAALQYERSFGKNNVGGLLLFNRNKQWWTGYKYNEVPVAYQGIVGRVTYNYDYRYLLELSLGRNGSENFPPWNRYGTFPALSAGWNITQEPFMKTWLGTSSTLSLLKLRASYGETGNDKFMIGNDRSTYERFMYFPAEYTFTNNRAQFGEELTNYQGVVEGKAGNPDITWEKAIKQNYGIASSFFDGRLNISFDYFIDYRNNILTQPPTTAHVGTQLQDVYNLAKVRNKGYEIQAGWKGAIGAVNYWINGNYTFARNKVLENGRPESPQNQLGNALNQTYGLIALGFFNTQEEADAWPLQYASRSTPGDVKYLDYNHDGKINENDFSPIGHPVYPEINYGIGAGLSYKGFDLSLLFQGAANVSRVLSGYMQRPANQFGTIWEVVKDERWTPENAAHAKRPKLTATYSNSTNYQNSTLWMRDGSYLRLKNIELGYNFNSSLLKRIGITTARLYASGQNLITWDKLKVVDPEQQASNSFQYPQLQIFNAGLNIQF